MTKYNECTKQNCFVINKSVFWLNKAVLRVNNFIRGLTKFWNKSHILKRNICIWSSAPLMLLKPRKNSCRTVFFFCKSASNFAKNNTQVEITTQVVILFF